MSRRAEATASVTALPEPLFAYLDDQKRLAGHMSRSSAMMGGGRMTYEFDDRAGRAVGSRIVMRGRAFGFELLVEELVTEREPPRRKAWRTVGKPRLVVIGAYSMGFEITPGSDGSALRVWIEYALPERGLGRLIPALGALYARWCVKKMAQDAASHFARRPG